MRNTIPRRPKGKFMSALNEFLETSYTAYHAVKNTAEATQLILKHPELFTDYEIKKGGMDDVFLAATGKKLSGGAES